MILEAKPKNESMFDLPIPTDGAKLRSMAGAMIYIRVSTKGDAMGTDQSPRPAAQLTSDRDARNFCHGPNSQDVVSGFTEPELVQDGGTPPRCGATLRRGILHLHS